MTADPHADDLLSALVDGELDPDEVAAVRAHVARCEQCAAEVGEIERTRGALRGLDPLDGSAAVLPVIRRHRSAMRTGLLFVGAFAALALVLAAIQDVNVPTVVPPVETLASTHTESTHDDMAGGPTSEVSNPYVAPASVGSEHTGMLSRRQLFEGSGLVTVVYGSADAAVSVFEQLGQLDWDELGAGASFVVAGRRVWQRPGSPVVLVTEAGHLVVTVVSDDEAAARATVAGLPDGHRDAGTTDRVHDACQRVAEVFSLNG